MDSQEQGALSGAGQGALIGTLKLEPGIAVRQLGH